jgi:hypothetical protein
MTQDAYAQLLIHARRANFELDEVLREDQPFDFSRPFLPEALARTDALSMLTPAERLVFNQVRAHTYLGIFALVEEFILPFLLDHARTRLHGSDSEVRALLQFAGEEAKHIELFQRFGRVFQRGFESECSVIGPADQIARAILAHEPLSVALAILHIEWMTQAHYLESVRNDESLEPHFKELLRCHWMEEAQHAKLDTLIVEALGERCTAEERARALDGYLAIGGILAGGVAQQLELDIAAFERKTGRVLTPGERAQVQAVQLPANHYTYLGSGMLHAKFQRSLAALGPELLRRVQEVAPAFC